ncbi:MAG: hypothetical protein RR270_07525 [Alistipes sp.]
MSNNPMIQQIDRLVGDLLAGGGEVFLPGVGSLYTERLGAQRLSKGRVQPPCCEVSFQTAQRGVSLVDEIAAALQCDVARAQSIYDNWLSETYAGNTLTIEGVGVLKFKNLKLDKLFDLRLNPQGREPIHIQSKRRVDWALGIGIAAILIAAGIGGYQFLMNYSDQETELTTLAQTEQQQEAQSVAPSSDRDLVEPNAAVDSAAVTSPTTIESAPNAASATTTTASVAPATSTTPASLVAGRFYVVLGVFSTADNAQRAMAEAAAKKPALRCEIYDFNHKFLVSPFNAADAASCTQFIRAEVDLAPDMWTYTAR